MGRKFILVGLWLLGFILGFVGYLAAIPVEGWLMQVLPTVFGSGTLVGAFLTGIAGSLLMTVSVVVWAKLSG